MKALQTKARSPQRGVALLTVVGLMLVLLIFAGALIDQLAMETVSIKQHGNAVRALEAANAGVHGMVAAIQDAAAKRAQPPVSINYTYPEAIGKSTTSYVATVINNWQSGSVNYYLIKSVGTYDNGVQSIATREVRAIVKGQPYTTYASFSINEVNQYGRPVWYRQDQLYDGPVYSGGPMRIDYNDGKGPIFQDTVLTGNTPIWNDQNDAGPPADSADWASIIQGGQKAFVVNAVGLQLPQPQDNLSVMSEAFQGNDKLTTYPTVPNGLYVNAMAADTPGGGTLTSGIYINANGGNVTVDGSSVGSTEVFTFRSGVAGFGVWKVTVDFSAHTTTFVHNSGSPVTYNGMVTGQPGPGNPNTGNGAIFTNGNVFFGGTNPDVQIQGDYTFAVPDYLKDQRSILINGNIKYADSTRDKLALWADNVIMNTNKSNLEVDGAIIAGFPGEPWTTGTFKNVFCKQFTCSAGDQGSLTIKGGIIENSRGALGVWIGGSHFGFSRHINFDKRLAGSPPPFTPTTGAYNIIAWDDEGA